MRLTEKLPSSYLVLFHVLSGEALKRNLCTVCLLKRKITDLKFLSVTINCFLHVLLLALNPDHDPFTVSLFGLSECAGGTSNSITSRKISRKPSLFYQR